MKNAAFWDVTPCGSCKNRCFGGTHLLHHQGDIVFLRSVRRLLVIANIVPSSPILITLMMEELRSSETSVLTRGTRRNIPEDDILQLRSSLYAYYTHVSLNRRWNSRQSQTAYRPRLEPETGRVSHFHLDIRSTMPLQQGRQQCALFLQGKCWLKLAATLASSPLNINLSCTVQWKGSPVSSLPNATKQPTLQSIINRGANNNRYSNIVKSKEPPCKIWGFHGGDYEEWRLLGCYAVWLL
jgi:hypothetical protein